MVSYDKYGQEYNKRKKLAITSENLQTVVQFNRLVKKKSSPIEYKLVEEKKSQALLNPSLLVHFATRKSENQFQGINIFGSDICQCQNVFHLNGNPRTHSWRRKKLNLNFHFLTSLWCPKRFYEGLEGFYFNKTF